MKWARKRFNKPEREGLAIEEQKKRDAGKPTGRALVRLMHRGKKQKHIKLPLPEEMSEEDLLYVLNKMRSPERQEKYEQEKNRKRAKKRLQ